MGVEAEHGKVHVGAARIDVHLADVTSLKSRRAHLRRIEARLVDLGCSVAEVGAQDRWQRAVLGVAIAASSASGVDRVLERIATAVEYDPRVAVISIVEHLDVIDADPA